MKIPKYEHYQCKKEYISISLHLLFADELVKFFATSERIDGLKISFGGLTSSVSEMKWKNNE